ncbi:MAG: hypothetical protein EHM12_12925 [Dehalococcoidia bacterium]|nr:MAG: hypothetical protein EHM12_12925 [Dehalococcoidia bacterium]
MKEMLKNIENPADVSDQAAGFRGLSKKEKLDILEGLRHIKNNNIAAYLHLVYPDETDKEIRKRIRALLHKLKTAGIHTEEPKTTGEPVLRKKEEKRNHKGFMSNYDDFNTRVVISAYEIKQNHYILLNGTIHFTYGLVELLTAPVSKHDLEGIVRQYRNGTGNNMVFVDTAFQYAGFILEEESRKSGRYREEMSYARRSALHVKDPVQKPEYIYTLNIPVTTHTPDIDKILNHAIFAPFKLTWSSLEEDKKDFNDLGNSAIVLPPYMVEEKRQAFLKTLLEKDEFKAQVTYYEAYA